jgi:hypothetical protein
MLEEQAFVGASISRFRFPAALLVLINSSATKTDSLGFTLHLRFNRASKPPRNQPRPASLTSTQLLLSAYNNQIILPSVYNPSHQPEITMKHFAMLAFVLAALFGTGRAKIYPLVSCIYWQKLAYGQNVTLSTTTATITKTIFHTVTSSVNLATLCGLAPDGPTFGSGAVSDYAPSVELKSVFVQTIELTSTIYSTEIDGVVVASLSTVVAPVTSTSVATAISIAISTGFLEVTSTKHINTTITTTSVVVSATTPRVTTSTSYIPIEQDIAQMWGLNGSEHLVAGKWLAFSVVLLSVAHYFFFAHY